MSACLSRMWAEDPVGTYVAVRKATTTLCDPLEVEDYALQSFPDASPPKWHLAHTAWFFETFILSRYAPNYRAYDPHYAHLFNSYYVGVGTAHPRSKRGLLSRPLLRDVLAYRAHVDAHMMSLLDRSSLEPSILALAELGLQHEQQHQELLLTDLKHAFAQNPILPAYRTREGMLCTGNAQMPELRWHQFEGGLVEIGASGMRFSYDNEGPRHRVWLEPFALASRPVTCGEFQDFISDGGYRRPELWQSEGFDAVVRNGWTSPLYWREREGRWEHFTLAGSLPVDLLSPVCHVSWYEADAFARWASARLPTEAQWETAAENAPVAGNFADQRWFHPCRSSESADLGQLFGDVWEWTASAYSPYPGFEPAAGAVGEYNGKFMCNQYVLRGGSCATPRSHIRATYRNYFHPQARWQFSGFRLARRL